MRNTFPNPEPLPGAGNLIVHSKIPCTSTQVAKMYKKKDNSQLEFENFEMSFGGKLRSDNRWIILSKEIPWGSFEEQYATNFSDCKTGSVAFPVRIALGALIIKEKLQLSDRETLLQICENPYLQYFLGFESFQFDTPFDHSLLTYFRKRFSVDDLARVNETIANRAITKSNEKKKPDLEHRKDEQSTGSQLENDSEPKESTNNGKLLIDTTVAPADITYPTDLNLLNDAREKTEQIIDLMHLPFIGKEKKPRTYRKIARKKYLKVAKQKRSPKNAIRKAIGQQLRFLRRNLQIIEKLVSKKRLSLISHRKYRHLLVVQELYRQQLLMYESRSHQVNDRIVSITQPHVRPMVRGKVNKDVEFGSKISASVVNRVCFVDRISWDNFNDGAELVGQVKNYYRRFGCYPSSVHADKIYQTRANRNYCKERKIRLSGPPLGRPRTITESNSKELKHERNLQRRDELDRIPIEGKFGQAKRRFGLDRVMTKLANTSETAIMVTFIVMNLERILADGGKKIGELFFRLFIWVEKSRNRHHDLTV